MQSQALPAAIRPECFLSYGEGWLRPTPEEIRFLISEIGLSGSQVAKLTGVKESRQVRRWISGDAPISFAAWALIVESAGYGKIWRA